MMTIQTIALMATRAHFAIEKKRRGLSKSERAVYRIVNCALEFRRKHGKATKQVSPD